MVTATLTVPTPPATNLVTAEEFVEKYSHQYAELIEGELKEYGMPSGRQGEVCAECTKVLGNFVKENKLGRLLSNDSHILIRRDPDTVRGPDVSYFSFQRMPPRTGTGRSGRTDPELIVEVRSPSNSWTQIFGKIGDYLQRGVTAILVLDPDGLTASVYRDSNGQVIFHAGDTLTIPDILPGFSIPVAKLFE
jgi:Uma2 family endonuclease